MNRVIPALLVALAASSATRAQTSEPDPLRSAECLAARDELEKALADPALDRQARTGWFARARQQAAAACLGRESEGRERSGAPQPAQVAPPVTPAAPRATQPPLPAIAPAPPPVAVQRPGVITTCDPAGCWDSEGRRLNNVGPLLMGPRGLCTLVGGQLNCP